MEAVVQEQQQQINQLMQHVQHLQGQIANQQQQPINVQVQAPPRDNEFIRLKPAKPSTFDGKSREFDVVTWISEVERYFGAAGVNYATDVKCLPYAVSLLKGDASIWWDNYVQMSSVGDEQKISYWIELKEAIKAQFQPANVSQNARDRLAELRQDTRSVLSYTAEFNKLCIRIEDIAESEKLDKYIRGLKPTIRKDVRLENPRHLVEAVRIAQTVDNIEWSERRLNYKSSTQYTNRANYRGPAPMEVNNVNVEQNQESETFESDDESESNYEEHNVNVIQNRSNNRKRLDLSPEEYKRRKDNRLCFKCGQPNCRIWKCKFNKKSTTSRRSQSKN